MARKKSKNYDFRIKDARGFPTGEVLPEAIVKIKPDYINKNIKKVSREDLLKAIREVNEKNEEHRRELILGVNKALSDGFRCGPKL